jgi:long-chain acyl-CoA synthetase
MLKNCVLAGDRILSYAQLQENGRRAARGLYEAGLREGDAVALLLRNDFAFLEATHAAALLGAYPVPINWHFKSDEVAFVLGDCGAKFLVAHADLLAGVADAIPAGMPVYVVPTPPEAQRDYKVPADRCVPAPDAVLWAEWIASFAPWDQPPRAGRPSMIYTSGTTGRPKGVRRRPMTPQQQEGQVRLFKEVYGVEPNMRALITGPLYHASPNAFARQAITQGDLLVLQSRFDAEDTLAAIAEHRITSLVMVPTMFVRLLKLPDEVKAAYDVSTIRSVIHTAAPCPPDVKRALIEWWGPVINEAYGGTESGIVVACNSEEWLAHPGTVGHPVEHATVSIYDEAGNRLPDGEVGEIYMRCDDYADFTYHNQDQRRRDIDRDGLVSLGDVGFMKDGYLYLCDRKADMVIAGGVNIYPAEIEAVLLQCPDVRDAAVFGIPDDDLGETLLAAIEPVPGTTPDAEAIKRFLAERIALYKVPRLIVFHDTLPREDSGKLFKRKLREPYWAGRERRI